MEYFITSTTRLVRSEEKLNPLNPWTRSEICVMLHKSIQILQKIISLIIIFEFSFIQLVCKVTKFTRIYLDSLCSGCSGESLNGFSDFRQISDPAWKCYSVESSTARYFCKFRFYNHKIDSLSFLISLILWKITHICSKKFLPSTMKIATLPCKRYNTHD